LRYPIPGTIYADQTPKEGSVFDLSKKGEKDLHLEAAIERRREDLIQKIIKGQLRTDDPSRINNDLSLLTNLDFRKIERQMAAKYEIER
jgi:hypothetical protein